MSEFITLTLVIGIIAVGFNLLLEGVLGKKLAGQVRGLLLKRVIKPSLRWVSRQTMRLLSWVTRSGGRLIRGGARRTWTWLKS